MTKYSYHIRGKKSSLGAVAILLLFLLAPTASFAKMPDDPFADQWSYRDVHAYGAWDYTTGSHDVVVAVVDNGFDEFQPDLATNVWINTKEIPDNGIDDDHNGYVDDVYGWNFVAEDLNHDGVIDENEAKGNNDPRPDVTGKTDPDSADVTLHHGTVVAGIIGAMGDNKQLGTGIAWHVRLMNVKVINNSGEQDSSRLADAIRYAVDNGADIINSSLVGPNDDDIKQAVKYAYDHGVAVVAAAGNDYSSLDEVPRQPVCADAGAGETWVLGVSAIDEGHRLARFSNIGASCIDITAPGVHVSSTLRYAPRFGLEKLYGDGWNGTSFAAPFVTGAAALIKSIHPEWKALQIYHAILSTTHKTPPQDELAYEATYGKGLLDIQAAVAYAVSQKIDTHPLTNILTSDGASGRVHSASFDGTSQIDDKQVLPVGVEQSAAFHSTDSSGFVAIVHGKSSRRSVVVYDTSWQEQKRWVLPFTGTASITIGIFASGGQPEIVVAPASANKLVFVRYALDGKEINRVTGVALHRGVSLGAIDSDDHADLLAVYTDAINKKAKPFASLHRFDSANTIIQTIELPFVSKTGPVGSGDILGTKQQMYVVGTGVGDGPFLAYIDPTDGSVFRKFFAYTPAYTGGLSIKVGDYNIDGADDIVIAPLRGGQPVVVWSGQAKKIASWWPFGEGDARAVSLLGATQRP